MHLHTGIDLTDRGGSQVKQAGGRGADQNDTADQLFGLNVAGEDVVGREVVETSGRPPKGDEHLSIAVCGQLQVVIKAKGLDMQVVVDAFRIHAELFEKEQPTYHFQCQGTIELIAIAGHQGGMSYHAINIRLQAEKAGPGGLLLQHRQGGAIPLHGWQG